MQFSHVHVYSLSPNDIEIYTWSCINKYLFIFFQIKSDLCLGLLLWDFYIQKVLKYCLGSSFLLAGFLKLIEL